MSGKTQMSDKTKKILTGVGIGFGTLVVFLASFILAFSLIVNPINFFTVSDAGTVEENEKLKEEVQTLTDEIEHLNTTVDKYKASANSASVTAPATVTTSNSSTNTNTGTNTSSSATTQKPETSNTPQTPSNTEASGNGTSGSETNGGFSPDTVNSTAESTPEDVEEPITVIDVSE